jgi:hypothetical protein
MWNSIAGKNELKPAHQLDLQYFELRIEILMQIPHSRSESRDLLAKALHTLFKSHP